MVLHNDKNSVFLETTIKGRGIYELEANAFAVQLLHEYLNLNSEIPIIAWSVDNYGIKRRVSLVRKP